MTLQMLNKTHPKNIIQTTLLIFRPKIRKADIAQATVNIAISTRSLIPGL